MLHRSYHRLTNTISEYRTQREAENQWYGDTVLEQKAPGSIRMMFHNIRHLPLHGVAGVESFIHNQFSLQVDLQGFSEHCLDTSKFQVYQRARDILRSTFSEQATLQLNSSTEQALHHYKPGGTGILILGRLSSRLEPQGKGGDQLGRWSYVHLRRKNLPPVTVISIYQVCPRPTNAIGNTAYHQQMRSLEASGRHVHPRKAFIEDLQGFLHKLICSNHDIIVGGDFNESLQDKNSSILQLATIYNLTDPFLHRFPNQEEFGTHLAGRRRIDLVLVTPRILNSIQKLGYGPFDCSTASDHRPLIIDFDCNMLLGQSTVSAPLVFQRGVRTKDRESVKSFISHSFHEIQRRNGFNLQHQLDDDSASHDLVELIDEIIGTSEHIAEKKCRRRRPEYYSRLIAKQRLEVSLLNHHLRAMKMDRDRSQQLRQKMRRSGVEFDLPATPQLTRQALQSARSRLQETTRNQFAIRQHELTQDVHQAADKKDFAKSNRISSIKKAEQVQKTFRILRSLRNQHNNVQQLDRVEIPNSWPNPDHPVTTLDELEDPKTCQEWRLVTEPNEVEYYLMLRNRLHFGQAQGTPFTCPPLDHDFDWAATSRSATSTLKGEYPHTLTTRQCTELLSACQARTTLDSVSHAVTLSELRGKFKSWRETTTTSPSGRHLGRYKALFVQLPDEETPNDPDTGSAPTFSAQQESIARLKLSLLNYCIRNTYVLTRWKTVVNVMIFKEPGNFKIHRLRVIHIYEADFNALLAIKWRQLLHFADTNVLLHPGQYGGRPGCEAQSLTLLEELKYDISYLTRRSLFNFDNDATSCYDRILVPLASLINRKYGLDRRIVAIHAATLQNARFRLKTVAGISDLSYQHCPAFPIHGTGQGSGNSPCIWLFISSTLFEAHEQQAHGASFISPDGNAQVHFSMVGFVDDSTGSCNDFQPSTQQDLPQLFAMMAHDAQLWNDLLYCSGGKLELPKCSSHILHFDFLPTGKPIPSIERYENKIHLHDPETNASVPISSKRSFETHKTLGHQKSPFNSTSRWQAADLQNKANRLAILITTSPIDRRGALLAYHTIFVPSIKYTLPQSFFTRNSLDDAQATSLRLMIAKCGYNRNTARALLYAPIGYAGGGFLPWYLLQGEGQILHFVKHWRTQTIVSSTLRVAVHWAQWNSGHHAPILEDTAFPLPYLECRWIRSLREFLCSINATIHLDATGIATPERENDLYIMSYARQSGLFTEHDLSIINYCRVYLHVTTVSELFQADGRSLIPDLFHCRREAWFNPKTYITLQRRPSDFHIRTKWQQLCRQWATASGELAQSLNLGPWRSPGNQLRRRRETYITRNGNLYHWRYGSYWEYKRSDCYEDIYVPRCSTQWTPTVSCTPILAHPQHSGNIAIRELHRTPSSNSKFNHVRTFIEYLQSLPEWEQLLLQNLEFLLGPYELLHNLDTSDKSKTLYLVSDGSQRMNDLTFGWIFGSSEGVVYAENSGCGHGFPSSHRAEAWGMLSAITFLYHLQNYTQNAETWKAFDMEIFSDNSGLISRIQQRMKYTTSYPNSTLQPDWELIEQLHSTASRLQNKSLKFSWVRGHQQETDVDIPVEAKFNIRADQLAGEHQIHPRTRTALAKHLLPKEYCRLVIDQDAISGQHRKRIRHAYTLPPFFAYLRQRHQWDDLTHQDVDWQAYSHAARNSKISSVQLLKLVHNKLPTRYEKSKANPHVDPTCHYCHEVETFDHLLKCHNPVSDKFRSTLIETLETYFHSQGAPDSFRRAFFASTTFWLHPSASELPRPTSSTIHLSQQRIGWKLLPKGFLSRHWTHFITAQHHLYSESTKQNPTEFIAGIIKILWSSQIQLWNDHLSALGQEDSNHQTPHSLAQRQEYIARIRLLHCKRNQCLHAHQDLYFHQDLESFLTASTLTQMKDYLQLYEPVIQQSVNDASRIKTRSLVTFPGFHRLPNILRNHLRPRTRAAASLPQPNDRNSPSLQFLAAEGDQIPHKHSKWKSVRGKLQSVRNFFLPQNPT